MTPIDRNSELMVKMQAQEWSQVLNLLANAPYREVAAIIQKIGEQTEVEARKLSKEM